MKVILAKDIKKLGEAGSIVKVANGYARNYLFPQNMAISATSKNINKIEDIKKKAEEEKLAMHSEYLALANKITKVKQITFLRKADENDHLFGSVSENDIIKALTEKEVIIHRSNVIMDKHLKELGSFDVEIEFTSEIKANLKVNVEKENNLE
jgi:large subunit ribosomal protein L9